jgi:hypothetical protein
MPITYTNTQGIVCEMPTNQERIDALPTYYEYTDRHGNKRRRRSLAPMLLQDLQDSFLDLFGDEKASVAEMALARDNARLSGGLSEFRQKKQTKEEKAELYCDQVSTLDIYNDTRTIQEIEDAGENPPQMEWDEDEDRLHRNLMLFAKLMIEQGKLTDEDFED